MAQKIVFDEDKYDQLVKMLDHMEDTLLTYAVNGGDVFLDDTFTLVPRNQKWQPAVDLLTEGQAFGLSVMNQNELLRQAIVKFRNALVAAKGVFKDIDDLATYDVNKFVAEYPDFNAGGGLTTSNGPTDLFGTGGSGETETPTKDDKTGK
ncbi:hypothetical protein ACTG9Q_27590 [Actinokineospora sp. 24-640]